MPARLDGGPVTPRALARASRIAMHAGACIAGAGAGASIAELIIGFPVERGPAIVNAGALLAWITIALAQFRRAEDKETDMTCEARVPTLDPDGRVLWLLPCPAPATGTWRYECECGHARTGSTCDAHQPVGVSAGCLRCLNERGHECALLASPA